MYEESEKPHTNPVPVCLPRVIQPWPGNALALAEHRDWTVIVHSRE
jgi:hypothetical protein